MQSNINHLPGLLHKANSIMWSMAKSDFNSCNIIHCLLVAHTVHKEVNSGNMGKYAAYQEIENSLEKLS